MQAMAELKLILLRPHLNYIYDLLINFENFLNNPDKTHASKYTYKLLCIICLKSHTPVSRRLYGRIGRVLISLLLAEKKILEQPLLYISAYFEKNLGNYYTGLLQISQKSNWNDWHKIFYAGNGRTSLILP